MQDWKENNYYLYCLDVLTNFVIVAMEYYGKTSGSVIPEHKLPFPAHTIKIAIASLILIDAEPKSEESLVRIDNYCVQYLDIARIVDDVLYNKIAQIYGELEDTASERAKGLEKFASKVSTRYIEFSQKYKNGEIPEDDAQIIVALDQILKERKNSLLSELVYIRKIASVKDTKLFQEIYELNYTRSDQKNSAE